MATKLYEKDINKYVDWGGDEFTHGLPVSGEMIQKFIKDSLNSKFGYMHYDKDSEGTDPKTGIYISNHKPSNQYLIFADKKDFELWAANPEEGASLILGNFEAPAPATIKVTSNTDYSKTILSSDKDNQEISFNYIVIDKLDNVQAGESTISISINNNISGTRTLPIIRVGIPMDKEKGVTFPNDPTDNSNNGTELNFNIKDITKYLSEGINTINFTITSLTYNVSTTVTYQYRVLDLKLSSTFGNPQSDFTLYKCISLEEDSFNTSIVATGAGTKMLRVFIDGQQTYLMDNRDNKQTLDLFIGTNNPSRYDVIIPFSNAQGEKYTWATEGKHNLQMYFYIQDGVANIIKSQTLYYDFVLVEANSNHRSFILLQRTFENNAFADIVGEGQDPSILPQGSRISIDSEQYLSFSTDYIVLDTSGRGNVEDGAAVGIDIYIYNKSDSTQEWESHPHIPSGTGSTLTYKSDFDGEKELQIINTADANEVVKIDLNIKKSSAKIEKTIQGLELELSAVNRSNDEGTEDKSVWQNKVTNKPIYGAQFDKVLWNSQNGWDSKNNCLVLNNGATVTIPMNIFSLYSTGVTFEIDFETENVQDDNAIIMTYGNYEEVKDDDNNVIDRKLTGSGIQIKACKAELQSNSKINIHTNYKDGARQKIQFIFSYNGSDQTQIQGIDCPYLMYIVVNGILDRVAQFTKLDSCIGTGEAYTQFTIGNTEGKVTTKIHSIRAYTRALTLDECVDNFIIDSDDVRGNYVRNDIYNDGTKTINVDRILSSDLHIPVMTIYGNIMDSIVKVFNKKANVPVDILYQDPMHPEFNYFARDAWMSNQGTSSMNYPRRNFRPYFNKKSDSNTLRGFASEERYKYETRVWWGLTNREAIEKIQSGEQNPDEPFTINDIEYKPLRNKKTLKTPQLIDYDTAIMFVHSGIKIYKDVACTKKIKNLNEYINEYEAEHQNQNAPIYVLGAYARYKTKDLFTDRWTLKCDYAESSMTHNAGVGRLWGDVMRDVNVGDVGFTYDTDGKRIPASKPGATNAQRAVEEYNTTHADKTIKINGVSQQLTFGDIRTSCDGYPIIIINRPRNKKTNGSGYEETYGNPIFLGLYNIMTDKGSTPLFGFEDLKDEDGVTIFNAGNDDQRTECWECLQNGSRLAQMNDATTDIDDGSQVEYTSQFDADGEFIEGTGSDNEDRPIFKTYEARWPDNKDLNKTCTNNLETVIRFVNFCKDAVSVTVDGQDGYALSDYRKIDDFTAETWSTDGTVDTLPNKTLYLSVPGMSPKDRTSKFYKTDSDGAIIYNSETGKPEILTQDEIRDNYLQNQQNNLIYKDGELIIYHRQTYASQITATSSGSMEALYKENETDLNKIISAIVNQLNSSTPYVYTIEESDDPNDIEYRKMKWYPNATDDIRQWYYLDKTFDHTKITKIINTTSMKDDVYTGRVFTYDGKRMDGEGQYLHPDAWVTVYLTKNGNNYTYVDEMGHVVPYSSGEEPTIVYGSGEVVSKTTSFKNKTKFEYFQDQKYEHFDVWKLACYYVYLMRFAAVDQVIKNTMMTTEDGKHYYFINYDNDTILGVRNDGYLAYDWQVTRETYDESAGSYAYAGFGSVLWNLLEQDSDFLDKVKKVATAMVDSHVLTYDIAVDMFNNQQSGTWSERLYNQSEMYKYIGIYNDIDNEGKSSYNPYQNTKYLPFLQGSRASHRDWWLRHRFDLYDSKWSAGEYANNFLQFIMNVDASPSNIQPFLRIVSGSKFYYSIIVNNDVFRNNFIELEADQEYTFLTDEVLITGNPMRMLGVYKAKVLDFSPNRQGLTGELQCNWLSEKGSLIEELILGGNLPIKEKAKPGEDYQDPCTLQNISNINLLKSLKVLDIRTCQSMNSIDISELGNLKKFLADDSAITNFIPATGVMLEEVSLPSSISTLKLNGGSVDEFRFTPSVALTKVEIENVEGEAFNGSKIVEENGETFEYVGHNLFEFILNWYIILKKANAKMSDYSCALSFNKIELMPFYGPAEGELANNIEDWLNNIPKDNPNVSAATKKIKSLDLLNAIKEDFGFNNLGEENFVINKGVIKLCGDNDNGGLTQKNYDELRNAKYINSDGSISDISLWDESVFRSDSPFHFDSNESIFITITGYGDSKQPVYDGNSYTIIAGQSAQITVIIFPINNNRQIDIIPYTLDSSTNDWEGWEFINGVWGTSFDKGPLELYGSYLSNDNGTAILNINEYTDLSNKSSFRIYIYDSLQQTSNKLVAQEQINIENLVKPNASDIILSTTDNIDVTNIIQTIEVVQNYKYILSFDTPKPINVDIDYVAGSFNSNTVVSESNYGNINVEFDDELGSYVLNYLPNIQNDNTTISLYAFVRLKDKQNTLLKQDINIRLKTTKINGIDLSYNNNGEYDDALQPNIDGELTIEHYVKDTSKIKTVGTKKVITYNYKVNIIPKEYNVSIKSMEIVLPTNRMTNYNVNPINAVNNPIIIESIDIELPVAKTSMYESGDFEIVIKDVYDNEIRQKVNVILGYFLPDGINLIKTIDGIADNSDHPENTTLLMGEFPTIHYDLHTYSKIGNNKYIWGDEENIQNKYDSNDNTIIFLDNTKYPEANYSSLSNPFTAIEGVSSLQEKITQYTYTTKSFEFKLIASATGIFVRMSNIKYSVTFNGKETLLDTNINVTRTAAIATNFNIHSPNIHAFNDTDEHNVPYTEQDCLYLLDKYGNLYNLNGYQIQTLTTPIREYYIALIFVYLDNDSVRKYTSLDIWKLESDIQLYKWYSTNSTFARHARGMNFNNQPELHKLFDEDFISQGHYNQYLSGYVYQRCYDYYGIICAKFVGNDHENGASFKLQSVNSNDIPNDLSDLCDAYRKGEIKFTRNSPGITDPTMVFYYINDYKKLGFSNMVCKPLSSTDYMNVMNHYNAFKLFLDKLDPNGNLSKNLFDKTNTNFTFDSSKGETFDDVFSIVETGADYNNGKMFWNFDTIIQRINTRTTRENIQIAYDENGSVEDMKYRTNNDNKKSVGFLTYCLFGMYSCDSSKIQS